MNHFFIERVRESLVSKVSLEAKNDASTLIDFAVERALDLSISETEFQNLLLEIVSAAARTKELSTRDHETLVELHQALTNEKQQAA